MVQHLTW